MLVAFCSCRGSHQHSVRMNVLIGCSFLANSAISLVLDQGQWLNVPSNVSVNASLASPSSLVTIGPTHQNITSLSSLLTSGSADLPVSAGRQGKYVCDVTYGSPSMHSCLDALLQMPTDKNVLSYGDRNDPHVFDFPLPIRYSSSTWDMWHMIHLKLTGRATTGDGSCVIEIRAKHEGGFDHGIPENVKTKVRYMINKCVKPIGTGGIGVGLGEY